MGSGPRSRPATTACRQLETGTRVRTRTRPTTRTTTRRRRRVGGVRSSTNITYLVGDVFAVILIILISILVLVDTFIILFSFKAVSGKPGLVFSKPWRNLGMLLVIILTIIYALTSQHPLYTWDLGPSLGWGVISVIMLMKCLLETTVCNKGSPAPPEDNVLHFLM